MVTNKNISVWFGDRTPPTDYHLWETLDGTLYTKVKGDKWIPISGSGGGSDAYIPIIPGSTDVQQANGSTISINKFLGSITYDSTIGEFFLRNPLETEDIETQVISLPVATVTTAGLMSATDKQKLDSLIGGDNWEVIE